MKDFQQAEPRSLESNPPDWLDDVPACSCGSLPIYLGNRSAGGVEHLACPNKRCGRIVVIEGRGHEAATEIWKKEIEQELCTHDFFVRPDGSFSCIHCDLLLEKGVMP